MEMLERDGREAQQSHGDERGCSDEGASEAKQKDKSTSHAREHAPGFGCRQIDILNQSTACESNRRFVRGVAMPDQYNHNDIMQQLEAGSRRFSLIDEKLTVLLDRVEAIPQIQHDLATAKADIAETKEIVEAWMAVKTFGRFLKWLPGVLAGILALVAMTRGAIRGFL